MASTARTSRQIAIPAAFYRGGTSNGIMFNAQKLPSSRREDWAALFLGAMGSPCSYGRQLDGMGGGVSSLSKICVIGPSSREDADVDYTFVQIGVKEPTVDYGSQCGNMVSAVGPFAIEEGLAKVRADERGQAMVRIHNTNTQKVVHAHFQLAADGSVEPDGDYAIDGVSGTASRVTLDFLYPGGSRTGRLLPSGRALDRLEVEDRQVDASLVDCGNPCVFVRASDLDVDPLISPDAITAHPDLLARLEAIRQAGILRMGMASTREEAAKIWSVPKICMVSAPSAALRSEADIVVRTISSGDPHRALPMTVALCIAAAAKIPGSIVSECVDSTTSVDPLGIVIAHPSGKISVSATMEETDGETTVKAGTVYRTMRKLFEGTVFAKVPS